MYNVNLEFEKKWNFVHWEVKNSEHGSMREPVAYPTSNQITSRINHLDLLNKVAHEPHRGGTARRPLPSPAGPVPVRPSSMHSVCERAFVQKKYRRFGQNRAKKMERGGGGGSVMEAVKEGGEVGGGYSIKMQNNGLSGTKTVHFLKTKN